MITMSKPECSGERRVGSIVMMREFGIWTPAVIVEETKTLWRVLLLSQDTTVEGIEVLCGKPVFQPEDYNRTLRSFNKNTHKESGKYSSGYLQDYSDETLVFQFQKKERKKSSNEMS